jgi:hypothetical protein
MSEILTGPDAGETISIPASAAPNSKENTFRLCEYDTESQIGCRRTSTILALEAEYDTFVDPEMYWGYWDEFCRHDGNTYYYKDWMKTNVQRDQSELSKDSDNTALSTHISKVVSFLGAGFHEGVTVEFVQDLFANPPAGFPTLVIETPQFYQCIDLGTDVISIDSLDKALLTKIQNTFTDNINPLLADLTDKLYLVDDKVYCCDYLSFENNPTAKLGVLMIAKDTSKYVSGNAYFFPFAPLTPEQQDFVTSMALIDLELTGEVIIVNL